MGAEHLAPGSGVYLDPSRESEGACGGIYSDDCDEPVCPDPFVDSDDWPHDAAGGEHFRDRSGCNSTGRDRNDRKAKTGHHIQGRDRFGDGVGSETRTA